MSRSGGDEAALLVSLIQVAIIPNDARTKLPEIFIMSQSICRRALGLCLYDTYHGYLRYLL